MNNINMIILSNCKIKEINPSSVDLNICNHRLNYNNNVGIYKRKGNKQIALKCQYV